MKNVKNIVNGYISIMTTHTGSSLVKYNKNFEIIWKRDKQNCNKNPGVSGGSPRGGVWISHRCGKIVLHQNIKDLLFL